jgi:hypothetical protein
LTFSGITGKRVAKKYSSEYTEKRKRKFWDSGILFLFNPRISAYIRGQNSFSYEEYGPRITRITRMKEKVGWGLTCRNTPNPRIPEFQNSRILFLFNPCQSV